ncbi:hypothetical protein HPB50_019124 [Hyalomma asiaticum]|uniref:Uncharacterized protein n=1 Tax=Hyalomma asiaticum TaxID=266040 RepID=A0ACB7SFH3_HYAAI|nr:hypothetical protein HPB50_019124 [Hyalomma asiaticum]
MLSVDHTAWRKDTTEDFIERAEEAAQLARKRIYIQQITGAVPLHPGSPECPGLTSFLSFAITMAIQESEGGILWKDDPSEDDVEEGNRYCWIILSLIVLLTAVVGVLGILYIRPPQDHSTTVDAVGLPLVPEISVHILTRPSEERRPHAGNASSTPQDPRYVRPPNPFGRECTGPICRVLATRLRSKLDFSVDPCTDFYKHVCSTFRGESEFLNVEKRIDASIIAILSNKEIPPTNQSSSEKAAAMYQACVSFASSDVPETHYLVDWMTSLNLDFLDEEKLSTVNPVEMIVRASLQLGIEALISIDFPRGEFLPKKGALRIEYSLEEQFWLDRKISVEEYTEMFSKYGAKPPQDKRLALRIKRYESARDWGRFFSKYTNGTYTRSRVVFHRPEAATIILKLFEKETVRAEGLRYLVAWNIYRQLVAYTDPNTFRDGSSASDACYRHIMKVMDIAVVGSYFQVAVPPRLVYQTKVMVSRIRTAFENALNSSSWLDPIVRSNAINKLINITVYVGSPGRRLDPKYVEDVYKNYPDAPLDRLFPTWIKAHSLATQFVWANQTYPLYDDAQVNALYHHGENIILVPTAIMSQPFVYLYGPIGLNYGGLGMLSLNGDQDMLNATLDSENLADLVGTRLAYAAYSSLPKRYKDVKLAGFDMSTDRLFFVNHCVKWCNRATEAAEGYSTARARCIVPLMNMDEFSRVYECSAGAPMNPRKKCEFW